MLGLAESSKLRRWEPILWAVMTMGCMWVRLRTYISLSPSLMHNYLYFNEDYWKEKKEEGTRTSMWRKTKLYKQLVSFVLSPSPWSWLPLLCLACQHLNFMFKMPFQVSFLLFNHISTVWTCTFPFHFHCYTASTFQITIVWHSDISHIYYIVWNFVEEMQDVVGPHHSQ